jgi:hypothetical protein
VPKTQEGSEEILEKSLNAMYHVDLRQVAGMIDFMEIVKFSENLGFRVAPSASQAIGLVVARLRKLGFRWGDKVLSKEAVVNASWIYLESLSDEQLRALFAEFLPRLRREMEGEARERQALAGDGGRAPIAPPGMGSLGIAVSAARDQESPMTPSEAIERAKNKVRAARENRHKKRSG